MFAGPIGLLGPYHELSFIGVTSQRTFTGVSANIQLGTEKEGSASQVVVATTYLLRSTQDVRLRQGNSAVTADPDTDFLLSAGTYFKLTVTNENNRYLAAITPTGGSNGTLDITDISSHICT